MDTHDLLKQSMLRFPRTPAAAMEAAIPLILENIPINDAAAEVGIGHVCIRYIRKQLIENGLYTPPVAASKQWKLAGNYRDKWSEDKYRLALKIHDALGLSQYDSEHICRCLYILDDDYEGRVIRNYSKMSSINFMDLRTIAVALGWFTGPMYSTEWGFINKKIYEFTSHNYTRN